MNLKNFSLLRLIIAIAVLVLLQGCFESQKPNKEPQKLNKIQGVIDEVEYIAEGTAFNVMDIEKTIVRFKDGRVKAFNGISNMVFQKGKYNIITYNKYNWIISVFISK